MRTITNRTSQLLVSLKYAYTPVSNYNIQNKINPVISVTFANNKNSLELHFRLFENVVPRTAENFKRLLLGTANYKGRSLSLIGNPFFNVIPRSHAEIGNLPEGNCSIFGSTFRDQSFELPHDRPGLLSCLSKENTCSSQFAITFAPCPFFDLKNVVFGEITAQTFQNLRSLEKLGSKLSGYSIIQTKELEVKKEDHHHH